MKVKDFLKKYQMSSNAEVFLEVVTSNGDAGNFVLLSEREIRDLDATSYKMNLCVQSFNVTDNIMTIYVKEARK